MFLSTDSVTGVSNAHGNQVVRYHSVEQQTRDDVFQNAVTELEPRAVVAATLSFREQVAIAVFQVEQAARAVRSFTGQVLCERQNASPAPASCCCIAPVVILRARHFRTLLHDAINLFVLVDDACEFRARGQVDLSGIQIPCVQHVKWIRNRSL